MTVPRPSLPDPFQTASAVRVSYARMFDDFKRMTAGLAEGEQRRLFHDNAAAFYRI